MSRYGKYKETQYFICKDCGCKFTEKDTYHGMKYPKEYIIDALTYYYNGMSFRQISHTFEDQYGDTLPKSTIWRWIIKYSDLVNQYVATLEPELSEEWLADETVVDIWGEHYYFWDIIDAGSRFLISSHLTKNRTIAHATRLFRMASDRSLTRPEVIRTDNLAQYRKAFNKVFYSVYASQRVEHFTSRGFGSRSNINLLERFHGNIKQRTKVMRDLKNETSAGIILNGFVTHYNFLLEHGELGGYTPAEIAGVGNEVQHWGNLIDDALMFSNQVDDFDVE
jgi:transposase-like protein